jgi:hypothetical protein
MSLYCDETGVELKFNDRMYALARTGLDEDIYFSAAAFDTLKRARGVVPRLNACKAGEKGLNVYEASYNELGFKRGKFLFSLTADSVRQHLPSIARKIYTPADA